MMKEANMAAPANAQELFDTNIPNLLSTNPAKAKEVGAVYFFKISGDGGGEWTVDLKSDPPTCSKGPGATPNCSIEIAHSDFMTMLTNPGAGMQLYFQGKLKVTGDPMLATKLQKIFSMA
jgi:hypothetical protein